MIDLQRIKDGIELNRRYRAILGEPEPLYIADLAACVEEIERLRDALETLCESVRGPADAMHDMFTGVTVDRAACSGLRRTRETASRVLGERILEVEIHSEFEEIRAASGDQASDLDLVEHIAFSHWKATSNGSRFLGGELYADYYARISATMELFTHNPSWHSGDMESLPRRLMQFNH